MQEQMICIDLGNKWTTVSDGKTVVTKLTTLQLTDSGVEIGKSRGYKNVIYDFVALLGLQYTSQQFRKQCKFHIYDFWQSKWGKIEIGVPIGSIFISKSHNMFVETVLALYLRKFIIEFIDKSNGSSSGSGSLGVHRFQEFVGSRKVYVAFSGSTHRSRYSLKQACQICGIQSPIFIAASHCLISNHYHQSHKSSTSTSNQNQNQNSKVIDACVLQFGDRGATISVYRLHSYLDSIIEVIEICGIDGGGSSITRELGEWVVEQIRVEKGIDISRHGMYMSLLHTESQKVKINVVESVEKEAHMRIPDLPDNTTFGKLITQTLLLQTIQPNLTKILTKFHQILLKHTQIKTVLLSGGSINISGFEDKIREIAGKDIQVLRTQREDIVNGIFNMLNYDIVLFDIADADYVVIGEEEFFAKLMDVGEGVPERREIRARFPAGELHFNLKVLENNIKIGQFLLDSRPNQLEFGINFEIDKNKLVNLHVKTDKGKIELIPNYQGIPAQQVIIEAKKVSKYKY